MRARVDNYCFDCGEPFKSGSDKIHSLHTVLNSTKKEFPNKDKNEPFKFRVWLLKLLALLPKTSRKNQIQIVFEDKNFIYTLTYRPDHKTWAYTVGGKGLFWGVARSGAGETLGGAAANALDDAYGIKTDAVARDLQKVVEYLLIHSRPGENNNERELADNLTTRNP